MILLLFFSLLCKKKKKRHLITNEMSKYHLIRMYRVLYILFAQCVLGSKERWESYLCRRNTQQREPIIYLGLFCAWQDPLDRMRGMKFDTYISSCHLTLLIETRVFFFFNIFYYFHNISIKESVILFQIYQCFLWLEIWFTDGLIKEGKFSSYKS